MSAEGTYTRLPPDIEREIGGLVVQWAYIESLASTTLYDVLKIGPKQGRLCFSKQSPERCLDSIVALAKLHKRTIEINVKTLRKNLESFGSWRNAIVHGVWTPKKGVRGPVLLLTRSEVPEAKTKPKSLLLTARGLKQFNEKISRIVEMMEEFHHKALKQPSDEGDVGETKASTVELLEPMPLRLIQTP